MGTYVDTENDWMILWPSIQKKTKTIAYSFLQFTEARKFT